MKLSASNCVIDISRGPEPLPGEPEEPEIRTWLQEALAWLGQSAASVSVRILDTDEMAALNGSFRNQASPTNVLSFPDLVVDENDHQLLGDIALCSQVVQRESQQFAIPFRDRYAHILVHGLLHLLGHDHQQAGERATMEKLEVALMAQLGMMAPYELIDETPEDCQQQGVNKHE